ncbi:MAG: 4-hydroxy-tetrahydrodipicolinate reductase [Spirochaetia bacterium]|nr:4-hydroxy-tetrahydrodipicolinate reductase [Spirochaetia bacterium]MCF7953802.1 4-hydroxy-tetrahydrodipicolinate reductase [Spirochaetales bacterium]
MRIGICGYGRMGHLIRSKALERGHEVPVIIDPVLEDEVVTAKSIEENIKDSVDAVIDFSVPDVAVDHIVRFCDLGVNVVMGTTGWYETMDEVKKIVEESSMGMIWSGNFSLGVNIFFHMVRKAGNIMNNFDAYDAMVHETHHKFKADSPSGTANMLGNILLKELDRKDTLVTDALYRPIEQSELHVSSTRGGQVPGTHQVVFDSDVDSIELTHTARNRNGFAEGAVLAAEWIAGKEGFYGIDDMMETIIEGRS